MIQRNGKAREGFGRVFSCKKDTPSRELKGDTEASRGMLEINSSQTCQIFGTTVEGFKCVNRSIDSESQRLGSRNLLFEKFPTGMAEQEYLCLVASINALTSLLLCLNVQNKFQKWERGGHLTLPHLTLSQVQGLLDLGDLVYLNFLQFQVGNELQIDKADKFNYLEKEGLGTFQKATLLGGITQYDSWSQLN